MNEQEPRVSPGTKALRRQLGKQLTAVRTLAGLSQRELEKALPVSQSMVSRAETGEMAVSNQILTAWLNACDAKQRHQELLALNALVHDAAAGVGTVRALTLIDGGDEPFVRVMTCKAELLITERTLVERYRALFDMITGSALSHQDTIASRIWTDGS